jgi:hypothetical protein
MSKKKIKALVNSTIEDIDMKHVPLGTRMKDLVTGFEGIAIARVEFLNGCIQYMLKPQKLDKDGKTIEANAIDSEQLRIIDTGISKKEKVDKEPTGGIMPDTPVM